MQKTILSQWKKNFSKNKSENFMWDNVFGMQSKKDFIIKAYLIADYIKKVEWDYIGIMLPAVWSAPLLIIATYLAGKTPVMFNWTLGKEAFDHCVKFSKVDKILTSSNFYDRVKNDFLDEHNNKWKFVFLEELLKNVSIFDKVWALIKSFYMPVSNLSENAVILFTSWSESLPKAVPLTHKNLISDIKWSLDIFNLKQDDRLIWFLPPFHSFGFTINTIMPLITGLQAVYTPDPNDAKTILNIIKHTKVTSITATPTFLKMIMSLASWNDLHNIRYAVVWAEKCPNEVFKKFKKLCPDWVILEWYGITECSPVVSINPIESSKPWTVWKIILSLECIIIDMETNKEVKTWEQGMIYVWWSSIFKWYLDKKIETPFEKIDWKSYYKTGDLWFLDEDGFLTITWRLKRFIKIAWEMISLPFVEWVLLEKYGSDEELKIAIEALEKDWEAKIVLFSLEYIETEEVNDYLRKRWVSNLVKVSEVIKIKEIPVLWTGKTDYKELKKLISF
jgi:acyl-CoA synthetase (AMP-forming)/AMP-acid ligase II